jgi:hypothetical protein
VGLLENGRLKAPEYDWKFFAQMAMYVDKNPEELQALVSKCVSTTCCTDSALYPSVHRSTTSIELLYYQEGPLAVATAEAS